MHTLWVEAEEIRPRAEWVEHLASTGREPVR